MGFASPMQAWVERFFNDESLLRWPLKEDGFQLPAVNVRETEDAIVLELATPGYEKADFKVFAENGVLVVQAEKRHESEEKSDKEAYLRKEFSYSRFERRFALPEGAEEAAVSASCAHGVLTVTIPRRTGSGKAAVRQIQVQG